MPRRGVNPFFAVSLGTTRVKPRAEARLANKIGPRRDGRVVDGGGLENH